VIGGLAGALSMGAGASAAPSEQDAGWMAAAHQSNLAEIAAGNVAVQRATSDEVRSLGSMFVEMHTALDADLTAAAAELGVALPAAPNEQQQASLARAEAQQGEAFDATWVAEQTAGHQTTLAATQAEIAGGSDATVVGLANAAAPVVEQHLADLQALGGAGAPELVPTGDGGLFGDDQGASPWPLTALAIGLLAAGGGALLYVRRRS
jgi:putative membrane protein